MGGAAGPLPVAEAPLDPSVAELLDVAGVLLESVLFMSPLIIPVSLELSLLELSLLALALSGEAAEGPDNTLKVRILESDELSIPVRTQKTGKILAAIRPEEAFLGAPDKGGITGEIVQVTFLGDTMNYRIKLKHHSVNDQVIEVNEYTKDSPGLRNVGDIVGIIFNIQKINLYTEDGSESLI